MTTFPLLDTHVILRSGDKILLSQRGGWYEFGRWHLPSGKLRANEWLPVGAARGLFEETGVLVDPERLRLVHVVHHRHQAESRVGFFFLATQWTGAPYVREPDKCLDLQWFDVHQLPGGIRGYPAAGLRGCLLGTHVLTLYGW